jgi:hypothetical protein
MNKKSNVDHKFDGENIISCIPRHLFLDLLFAKLNKIVLKRRKKHPK